MYFVYILECADTTLYTGITTDVNRRIEEHNESKRGAKYTKARRPLILRHVEKFRIVNKALKREAAIKKLTRREKLKLILQK